MLAGHLANLMDAGATILSRLAGVLNFLNRINALVYKLTNLPLGNSMAKANIHRKSPPKDLIGRTITKLRTIFKIRIKYRNHLKTMKNYRKVALPAWLFWAMV